MPELPEVETTRRGLEATVAGAVVHGTVVREKRLRWPVPDGLDPFARGCRIAAVRRRAKYLLFELAPPEPGSTHRWLIVHLGMSGSLRRVPPGAPLRTHDHVDLEVGPVGAGAATRIRFHDPRRFGSIHIHADDPGTHPLLRGLGPEPLGPDFDGDTLYARSRGRRVAVKGFLMDARTVVGVGNIYASEALFRAGIRPDRAAGRVGRERYRRLAAAVRAVLSEAIEAGGTTLRDFSGSSGEPGFFAIRLDAYGQTHCPQCAGALRNTVIAQRSSYFCPRCQR